MICLNFISKNYRNFQHLNPCIVRNTTSTDSKLNIVLQSSKGYALNWWGWISVLALWSFYRWQEKAVCQIKWMAFLVTFARICQAGPWEPPEDGEMNEMTLPSRHRIRNSSPGGLRPSTLPLVHGGSSQYWIFTSERGRNILFFWNLKARVGLEPAISKQAALTIAPGPPLQAVFQILGRCCVIPLPRWCNTDSAKDIMLYSLMILNEHDHTYVVLFKLY